ncbi:MAG: hypothetical protein CMM96_00405 [Rickettsiales bacterium]|nr:hypothetical protein [Rickettsiales bacterium]|tara:strand:+ start:1081 stop:2205 length:1125 start_codon:yes stop_codon:yes gene_type:complete
MKKNIVIIISALNMGGAQRVVSILANNWSKSGYKVTLISTFSEQIEKHFIINDNVKILKVKNSPFLSDIPFINLIWKLLNLRMLIKAQNPDIVISFLARVNIAAALATIGLKPPLIICERTWPPFTSLSNNLNWIYKIIFRRVNQIIVQTNESKSWLRKNYTFIKAEVIPNPVVYPLPKEASGVINPTSIVSPERKIILASGRFHKFKQFNLLINAFSMIKEDFLDWDLIILGDGEERQHLETLSKEVDVLNRIFLPGSVGNIADWYQRADLFVLSSIVEGFPNVLVEALSYGVPSISFDCDTGPRDIIEDGFNGILVDPNKREIGLRNALSQMINNKKLRSRISQNSLLIRDKYSINNIMSKWDRVLNSLISN